jgi:uncharacterized protein
MDQHFQRESVIEAPIESVFAYHGRPGALERLSPPWENFEVLERRGGIHDRGTLRARVLPGVVWQAQHTDYDPPHLFRDEQASGPFARWVHSHRFESIDATRTRLVDHIDYRLPLGVLGRVLGGPFVRAKLARAFAYRHAVTAIDNERIAWALPSGKQRIAITGATGLIGTALGRFLTLGGHDVIPLVRSKARGIAWDPERGTIDAAALEGVDAVVHLAGEPIAQKRWTPEFREYAARSREAGTTLIARTLAALQRPPKVFVSAMAVGYYGDGGEAWLDETSPSGTGYLADLCRRWEAAAEPAAPIRTVRARIGLVLSTQGGPLAEMLRPFRWGIGGRFGNGRQFMPWIGIDDTVGALHRALFDPSLSGPVNLVAPNPVRNRDFARCRGDPRPGKGAGAIAQRSASPADSTTSLRVPLLAHRARTRAQALAGKVVGSVQRPELGEQGFRRGVARLDRQRLLELADRRAGPGLRGVNTREVHVRKVPRLVTRRELGPLEPGDCAAEVAFLDQVRTDVVVRISEIRIDVDRAFTVLERAVDVALPAQGPTEERVSFGGRKELDRLPVAAHGLFDLAPHLELRSLFPEPQGLGASRFVDHYAEDRPFSSQRSINVRVGVLSSSPSAASGTAQRYSWASSFKRTSDPSERQW